MSTRTSGIKNQKKKLRKSMQTVRRSEHKLTFLCPAAMDQQEVGSQNWLDG